jgi:hypothetical protein
MSQSGSQLASIFQQVAQTLVENRQVLNQADEVNQDHGDNMVQTFQTIAHSLQEKQGSSDSAALAFAAKQLSNSTTSASGQLYAKGLSQAATQFKGQQFDSQTAMQLLQTLIGGGQAPQASTQPAGGDVLTSLLGSLAGGGGDQSQPAQQPAGGDLLGALLGGLAGNDPGQQQQTQQQPTQPNSSGDLLGTLLGGLTGGNQSGSANNGMDMGDLLNAGMAFMQAKQSGGSNLDAIMKAFMAASGMGGSAHRTQSTQLVVSSFLKALGAAG